MSDIVSFLPVRAVDANGSPVSGAKAYFYDTGTTTPITVYANEAETTAHPSPLVANSSGIFDPVYRSGKTIKVLVTDADDVTLPGYPIDPVITVGASDSSASEIGFSPTNDIAATNVQAAVEAVQGNLNALGITAAGEALINDASAADQRTTLGLGTAAVAGLLDEDDMASDSAVNVPSQQSTKAYVDNENAKNIGQGQTWTDVSASRSMSTSYQNTTDNPIMVAVVTQGNNSDYWEVSSDNSTWHVVGILTSGGVSHNASFIVPVNHYYRGNATGTASAISWLELR